MTNGRRSSAVSPTPMAWIGMLVFLGERDKDAIARRAVELGHDDPGDPDHFAKDFRLINHF
jgi:hypothetical protein